MGDLLHLLFNKCCDVDLDADTGAVDQTHPAGVHTQRADRSGHLSPVPPSKLRKEAWKGLRQNGRGASNRGAQVPRHTALAPAAETDQSADVVAHPGREEAIMAMVEPNGSTAAAAPVDASELN